MIITSAFKQKNRRWSGGEKEEKNEKVLGFVGMNKEYPRSLKIS
ncbi:hypothetical protein [Enterococcus asini]|nr:hypothetical protein [Enterococcus asini]